MDQEIDSLANEYDLEIKEQTLATEISILYYLCMFRNNHFKFNLPSQYYDKYEDPINYEELNFFPSKFFYELIVGVCPSIRNFMSELSTDMLSYQEIVTTNIKKLHPKERNLRNNDWRALSRF